MKTAIIYHSSHHGNTKKLLDGIVSRDGQSPASNIVLLDVADSQTDLSGYDVIGFASGIFYGKFHESVLRCAKDRLPQGKRVFFIYTYGVKRDTYLDAIRSIAAEKGAQMIGDYGCLGYDTFGPLKLVGGIAKGHPNAEDIAGGRRFIEEIIT
jgi:flavodoxin